MHDGFPYRWMCPGGRAIGQDCNGTIPSSSYQVTSRTPRTPFYLSSSDAGPVDFPVALLDEHEHLARDVAFEAADRLHLGMALADALGHIGLSARLGPQPADGNNVQRAVGGSIAASIQPM